MPPCHRRRLATRPTPALHPPFPAHDPIGGRERPLAGSTPVSAAATIWTTQKHVKTSPIRSGPSSGEAQIRVVASDYECQRGAPVYTEFLCGQAIAARRRAGPEPSRLLSRLPSQTPRMHGYPLDENEKAAVKRGLDRIEKSHVERSHPGTNDPTGYLRPASGRPGAGR